MSRKLDFNIGKVANDNNALISGVPKDIATFLVNSSEQIMNIVSPSIKVAAQNTLQAVRTPFESVFSFSNWGKALRTLPVVGADVAMKAARLPFSRLDDAVSYLAANNLERGSSFIKTYTTDLVANILDNNGQTRFKTLQGLANGVRGFGDVAGSIVKSIAGIAEKTTSTVDGILSKGTITTNSWVEGLRMGSDDDFLPITYDTFTNSSAAPQAANDSGELRIAA